MSEQNISISNLNDFVFCPMSIYFHGLDADSDRLTYQCKDQLDGTASHDSVDNGKYSSKQSDLQGIFVCSEKYDLFGKIDLYKSDTKTLVERKKKIKVIYDGYVFQAYAQYFALAEMGYDVERIVLHSMDDNKSYNIALPPDDIQMLEKFNSLINNIKAFDMTRFKQNDKNKCMHCIYEPLCSFSAVKEIV